MFDELRDTFLKNNWFDDPGVYALVDGQYGSTGKGAAAALIGMLFGKSIDVVTTNAGPNSGHTGYYPNRWRRDETEQMNVIDWAKVVTQQIPVAAVVTRALYPMHRQTAYLNGGAIIDPQILSREAIEFGFDPRRLVVHPNAAIIEGADDADSTASIASTNKGVGRALARKVMREQNVAQFRWEKLERQAQLEALAFNFGSDVVFVETAQGFSLGINQPFYPYATSRECTVQQALADAGIPARRLSKVLMTLRTFPIRVGNTDRGTSGGWYPDQQETTWEELGVEPEITTVTKRVRRVATWSWQQFRDAVRANEPDALWVGFMDYIKSEDQRKSFIMTMEGEYYGVMGRAPDFILGSYGPRPDQVKVEFAS